MDSEILFEKFDFSDTSIHMIKIIKPDIFIECEFWINADPTTNYCK